MNKDLSVWKFIYQHLSLDQPVMLLIVAESSGSSPGRQGFKMAVAHDDICGSIGGGIMEVKLAEHAKNLLQAEAESVIKHQVHRKDVAYDQSGMICSGEQTVVYFRVKPVYMEFVRELLVCIENYEPALLTISHIDRDAVLALEKSTGIQPSVSFEKITKTDFVYREKTGKENMLFIVGGGHCALALSELMSKFNFYITVIDDRPGLNTLHQNSFAQRIHVLEDYREVDTVIPQGPTVYVVIMTLGYRSDLIALQKLIRMSFSYLGLLGSKSKVTTLLTELENSGVEKRWIQRLRAPVGIPIDSHTPEEIAVSIAAEIIQHKNQVLA